MSSVIFRRCPFIPPSALLLFRTMPHRQTLNITLTFIQIPTSSISPTATNQTPEKCTLALSWNFHQKHRRIVIVFHPNIPPTTSTIQIQKISGLSCILRHKTIANSEKLLVSRQFIYLWNSTQVRTGYMNWNSSGYESKFRYGLNLIEEFVTIYGNLMIDDRILEWCRLKGQSWWWRWNYETQIVYES